METRKRWRKGEPGTREGVEAVLEALRDGIGAEAIGLFDDDRADPGAGRLNFWNAFSDLELPCLNVEWDAWYRELESRQRVETGCACGGHRLQGFLIHDRWALLLITPPALIPDAALAISSAFKALAEKLPPAMKRVRTGSDPAPASPPLWWVRKSRQ